MEISGKTEYPHITPPVLCMFGDLKLTHSFLVMPPYPICLLDLLHKIGAFLYILHPASAAMFLLQEVSDDDHLFPKSLPDSPRALELDHPLINPIVWETTKPQVASYHKPILISLKNPASYINSPHYLNIPWKFHIPYHPQPSGKVEHTNQTLKTTLTNLAVKTHLDLIKILPLASLE
jgi:hypothetical protein